MKRLPTKFRSGGWDFKVLARRGRVALLAKTKRTMKRSIYEVVIIQVHPAKTILGRTYPEREAMPPAEAWGRWGWTATTEDEAWQLFDELALGCPEKPTPFAVDASEASGSMRIAEPTSERLAEPVFEECPSIAHNLSTFRPNRADKVETAETEEQ